MDTKTMLRTMAIALMIIGVIFGVTMCASHSQSFKRFTKDVHSNYSGGIDRIIRIYTANGGVIAEYNGKIDIMGDGNGEVKFEYNGKRYIYYNCFVETIEN